MLTVAALAAGPAHAAESGLPAGAVLAPQDPPPRMALAPGGGFLASFGRMLFETPEILGERARALGLACASCHNGGDANPHLFLPGLSARPGGVDVHHAFFNPVGDDGRFDPLDVPSLRGVRFTAPYGRDGRIASLREFVATVIVTEFDGPEPTTLELDALTAFLDRLDFLPAPLLDRDGRLNRTAPAAAKRGEKLFGKRFAAMGGRSCASCHVPDRYFADGARHDIGSAGGRFPGPAFDTPTLLGSATTAPYFHDGALATLADVVAWFDRRYGLGLSRGGTVRPHRVCRGRRHGRAALRALFRPRHRLPPRCARRGGCARHPRSAGRAP